MVYNYGMINADYPILSKSKRILPAHYSWDDAWELVSDLPIEIRFCEDEVVAVTNLSTDESGGGATEEEAIFDLVTSLSDYFEWLEDHEAKVGPIETEDLKILRRLIRQRRHIPRSITALSEPGR